MMYYSADLKGMKEAAGESLIIAGIPKEALTLLQRRCCREIQIGIDDGRSISPAQRRKAYATLRDIGEYTGYSPEEIKEIMKVEHMIRLKDTAVISLADCSMTEAREFINTLMEYALKEGIILTESGLKRTDDIDTYLIQCIRYKRCCICGRPADIHHVDAVGMGNNRRRMDDSQKRIAALCRMHHTISHQKGWERFESDYHVYGIEKYRTQAQEVDIVDE